MATTNQNSNRDSNESNRDRNQSSQQSSREDNQKDPVRVEAGKKAMETRERNNPEEVEEARRKGGEHSHGGGRTKDEDR